MKVRPLGSRVLIERTPPESVTAGGLIIPKIGQEERAEGTIIAVGKGDWDRDGVRLPVDVKVGDKVIFSRYHGTNTRIGEKELVIVPAGDIHAVLEE